MYLKLILISALIGAIARCQIANDQEIIRIGQFLFDKPVVRQDECQCGKALRSSGEWITTCRLCAAEVAMADALYFALALDKKVVVTWATSDSQSCAIGEHGRNHFTAIFCSKTIQENIVYASFRLKPSDPNFKYDEMQWMCGAEAMVLTNKKAFFSNWGDGKICYEDISRTDSPMEMQSLHTTSHSKPVDAKNISTRRSLNLVTLFTPENIVDGTTKIAQRGTGFADTYQLLIIVAAVFAVVLITGTVVVVMVIRRLERSPEKTVSRDESQHPMTLHDDIPENKGCATYETLNDQHCDCASYASLNIKHWTPDSYSINMSNEVAAEQVNFRNSQNYQHLLHNHCQSDDYEKIYTD